MSWDSSEELRTFWAPIACLKKGFIRGQRGSTIELIVELVHFVNLSVEKHCCARKFEKCWNVKIMI